MGVFIYDIWNTVGKPNSGCGYIVSLFRCAFPESVLVRSPAALRGATSNDIIIVPIVFLVERDGSFCPLPSLTELCSTPATVVISLYWDTYCAPLDMFATFPRADYLHIPSKFLGEIFQHPRTIYYPPPPKPMPKKNSARETKQIGVLLASWHLRKNPQFALQRLAEALPNYTFLAVGDYLSKVREPIPHNVHELGRLGEVGLTDFYHSIDWFVVLSGGEGYCLPAREALRCGVPVIAPRHTAFLDLDGVSGVFLVNYEVWDGGNIPLIKGLWWGVPKIEEIVKVIMEKSNPPPDVADPSPTMEDWRKFWREKVEELRPRKVWRVGEHTVNWVTYPNPWGVGLNAVTRRWAAKVGGHVFPLHYSIPQGLKGIIVVPYYNGFVEWCADKWKETAPIVLLQILRRRNPNAKIVLWVHNYLTPERWNNFYRKVCDCIAVTSEEMKESVFFGLPVPVLPLPFGEPSHPSGAQSHFLFWGVNRTAYQFVVEFARYFPFPVKMLYIMGDKFEKLDIAQSSNLDLVIAPPMPDEKLEEELNTAKGYLCFDFYKPRIYGEASAKIPQVLFKNRPIIANNAPRNQIWSKYINLIDCPLDIAEAVKKAPAIAQSVAANLEAYIPRNLPEPNSDVIMYERFVAHVLSIPKREEG